MRGLTRRDFMRRTAVGMGCAATIPGLAGSGSAVRAGIQTAGARARSSDPLARISGGILSFGNDAIAAQWDVSAGGLRISRIEEPRSGRVVDMPHAAFSMTIRERAPITSSSMKLVGQPRVEALKGNPRASRLSERLDGWQLAAELVDADDLMGVTWRAILREGSQHIRQQVTFRARRLDLPVEEIALVDLPLAGAAVAGTVKGSPVTVGSWFFGFEHPLSFSTVGGSRVRCSIALLLPLKAEQPTTYSSVMGIAPDGQMRRSFLRYLEQERAHPYRTFLHYNSWYDLGFFTPFDEASALDAVEAFGRELHERRGVTLDSFLFDDGWDDHKIWGFNAGFPRGFMPLKEAAVRFGAAPGAWLSPWGGYGKPKEERLQFGKTQGFETNAQGFALSGPVYNRRFHEVCVEMIRSYGVNQFKFDGTGSAANAIPGSAFGSDFEAAISLIADLRAERPDLYVNLTTGTYPSPFWLLHADSTWRGGHDHDFAGVGSDRQQWITYRDANTYKSVVRQGPLYPLNALMLHGIIFARHAKKLDTDPGGDFEAEVRSYFGTGTQLQEMYITHSLLSAENWDALAEAANWSRRNADVLVDTHWVGGDPALLEVYGWASWSPGKGIITLRNPKDRAQAFDLDVQALFELPGGAPTRYAVRSPWNDQPGERPLELRADRPHTLRLRPFEVLTLELTP